MTRRLSSTVEGDRSGDIIVSQRSTRSANVTCDVVRPTPSPTSAAKRCSVASAFLREPVTTFVRYRLRPLTGSGPSYTKTRNFFLGTTPRDVAFHGP